MCQMTSTFKTDVKTFIVKKMEKKSSKNTIKTGFSSLQKYFLMRKKKIEKKKKSFGWCKLQILVTM